MREGRKTMFVSMLRRNKGTALIEFCFILPILVIMVLFIIDFGRLIQARIIITNVAREGGNLASRGIATPTGTDLITMLQTSAAPLDLVQSGRICISSIEAGFNQNNHDPFISVQDPQFCRGNLAVSSGISSGATHLGLTAALYDHLVFDDDNQAPDINGVTIVETFYMFRPITPLPRFIANIFLTDGVGTIVGSRAVFCTTLVGG
jgi:Flp pilus assembly protein TadG